MMTARGIEENVYKYTDGRGLAMFGRHMIVILPVDFDGYATIDFPHSERIAEWLVMPAVKSSVRSFESISMWANGGTVDGLHRAGLVHGTPSATNLFATALDFFAVGDVITIDLIPQFEHHICRMTCGQTVALIMQLSEGTGPELMP